MPISHSSTSPTKRPSAMQLYETFLLRMAIGVFLIGLAYVALIGEDQTQGMLNTVFDICGVILNFSGMAITLWGLSFLLKARAQDRGRHLADDSFVISVFRQSTVHSFSFTFVGLVFVRALFEFGLLNISVGLLLDIAMAAVMLFYAGSFYVQLRRQGGFDGDDEDDFSTETHEDMES